MKYEDIANEKEPNPEISEYVENRQEEEAGGFPKLSKAPSENDRPERKSDEEIKAEIESMAAARDALNEAVTADRAMADEDLTASDELTKASEKIQKALKRDD